MCPSAAHSHVPLAWHYIPLFICIIIIILLLYYVYYFYHLAPAVYPSLGWNSFFFFFLRNFFFIHFTHQSKIPLFPPPEPLWAGTLKPPASAYRL